MVCGRGTPSLTTAQTLRSAVGEEPAVGGLDAWAVSLWPRSRAGARVVGLASRMVETLCRRLPGKRSRFSQ